MNFQVSTPLLIAGEQFSAALRLRLRFIRVQHHKDLPHGHTAPELGGTGLVAVLKVPDSPHYGNPSSPLYSELDL